MFTKLFSKWSPVRELMIWVLIVFFYVCAMIISIIYIDRTKEILSVQQSVIEKRTIRTVSNISQKDLFSKSVQSEDEPELSFENFIIDEVLRVCTEVYPDLDPNYVLAIIYHESRFKPDAINAKTNATGLMQILPKWHAARAQKLGVSLTDPTGNILVGCDILNELYQQSNSFQYALNVYAGGYPYANAYKNVKSPFERELDEILASGVLYLVGR